MSLRIPPGGFAGFAQMTPASRLALAEAANNRAPTRRRKRRTVRKAARKSAARKKGNARKLKFGSPAWRKKYMKKRK